jgi:hypothetical protein
MRAIFVSLLLAAASCTTVGLARMRPLPTEFAYQDTLHLCVARDLNVTPGRVYSLVNAWNRGEGRISGIAIEVSRIEVAPRQTPGILLGDVLLLRQARYAARQPLGDGCDRWVYFAGAAPLDFFSFALSVVGAPIGLGMEAGRSVAVKTAIVHPVQLWPWYWPSSVVQHEIAHLFGCEDKVALLWPLFTWWSLDDCYESMASWKRLQMAYRDGQAARLAAAETSTVPPPADQSSPVSASP